LKLFVDSCDRTLEDDGRPDKIKAIMKRYYNKVKNQNQKGLKHSNQNQKGLKHSNQNQKGLKHSNQNQKGLKHSICNNS
jgi:hypothetical protein